MVNLQTIKAHNASLKSLAPGLVAVFVGGTSGIGLSTAREFVRSTPSPTIYLIGRSQSQANTIISELSSLNPSSNLKFIQSDVSSLRNVDQACAQILSQEKKVNLLFMTAGVMTFKGRDPTAEGLDKKFALHYYARMRFAKNLLPLLDAASKSTDENARLSRVVSVLDPVVADRGGVSGNLNYDDLSLQKNFSLKNCAAHAGIMNDFYLEAMAKAHPTTSFIHAYPSGVMTGLLRSWPKPVLSVAGLLMRPFMVNIGESGERHLYAATAKAFKAREEKGESAAVGSDGVKGSGGYWLNWNGDVYGTNKKLVKLREEGATEKILKHTEEVFRKVCEEKGTYP